MGGRDHSIQCEACGVWYSGFNGPDACDCNPTERQVEAQGGRRWGGAVNWNRVFFGAFLWFAGLSTVLTVGGISPGPELAISVGSLAMGWGAAAIHFGSSTPDSEEREAQ